MNVDEERYKIIYDIALETLAELIYARRGGKIWPPAKGWKWYEGTIREEARKRLEGMLESRLA